MYDQDTITTQTQSDEGIREPQTLAEWRERYSRVPYYDADWELLKALAIKENKSYRWIAKEFNIARNTIKKYVNNGATRNRRPQPVRDQWRETVRRIWSYYSASSDKIEITAKWIFSLLVEKHGYRGSERTVRTLILELKEEMDDGGLRI